MEAKLRPKHSSLCNDFLEQDRCPCILAEIKRCPICSHLQGSDLCNCDWVGTCVYSNYRFSDVVPLPPAPERKGARIIKAFPLVPGGMLVYVQVSPQMLLSLYEFSLIQLRYIQPPAILRVPAVVLEVFEDKNIVEIAVFTNDIQSQHLLKTLSEVSMEILRDHVIFGLVPLSTVKSSKILIVATDFGALLTPSMVKMLQVAGNEVTTALTASHPLIQERIKVLSSPVLAFDHKHFPLRELINQKYNFICSLTQDAFSKRLTNSLNELQLNVPLALLNNELFFRS